ncbi:MAG: hypothetical protein KJ558_02630 [Gammaproteobacteria bacterium]|nr:hypothetical protein [Gammaproteobacteria bacterium]MBU1653721.1 hypothetical protein [Gammaproteobacteria bacterium]MBU1960889.1 hypothetical protein [Gammaproteobacteria bacterium]
MRKPLLLALLIAVLSPLRAEAFDLFRPKDRDHSRLIVGDWEARSGTLVARVIINGSGNFSGVLGENGKVSWVYSGTWKIEGKELVWHYDDSLQSLPEHLRGKSERNKIMTLDRSKLVLQETDGRVTSYQRRKK